MVVVDVPKVLISSVGAVGLKGEEKQREQREDGEKRETGGTTKKHTGLEVDRSGKEGRKREIETARQERSYGSAWGRALLRE